MRNPPRPGAPRERTLPNGTEVKWCALCGQWINRYRVGYPAGEKNNFDGGDGNNAKENVAIKGEEDITEVGDDFPPTSVFTRLRDARSI